VFEDDYSSWVGKRSVKSLCCKNPKQTREYPSSDLESVSAPCYRFFIPSPFTTRWQLRITPYLVDAVLSHVIRNLKRMHFKSSKHRNASNNLPFPGAEVSHPLL
jgi:hypothetical protein